MAKGLFRRVAEKLFPSRQAPVRATTQAAQVRERQFGGSTKDMARAFGVSERAVQRWLKGERTPRGKDAKRLEDLAAKVQTTEKGRERRAKQVEKQPTGAVRLRVDRAQAFNIKGSPAIRPRSVMVDLTPEQAARLVLAGDDTAIHAVAEEAVLSYFNGGAAGYFGPGDIEFDDSSIEIL